MHLYILGAGASAEDKAPITNEIIDKAFWNFGGKYDGKDVYSFGSWDKEIAMQIFKPVFEIFDHLENTNFVKALIAFYKEGHHPVNLDIPTNMVEDFFTRLYYMQKRHEDYGLNLSTEGILKLNKNAGFFFFHTLCYETGFNQKVPHYLAFVKHALKDNSNHCIITFNYDLLLEEALYAFMKYINNEWIMLDNLNWSYDLPFSEVHRAIPKCSQNEITSRIHYLKLHGSFNWGYCPQCKQITLYSINADPWLYNRFYKEEYKCPIDKHVILPLLIPPILEKEIEPPFLRKAWEKARFFINQATEIHIIGYSLPDIDKEAQKLFSQIDRKKIDKIIIANPNRDHLNRIRKFLSFDNSKVLVYSSFKEYLKGEYGASI